MSYSITLTKRANEDLREILDYYNEQSAKATQSFLREFIAGMDLLSEHPIACPVAFSKVRKKDLPSIFSSPSKCEKRKSSSPGFGVKGATRSLCHSGNFERKKLAAANARELMEVENLGFWTGINNLQEISFIPTWKPLQIKN